MAIRVVFNRAAFRRIRTSPRVVADMARRAEKGAQSAGSGYVAATTSAPRNRARAAILAVSPEAKADNARNNTLIRALDSAK